MVWDEFLYAMIFTSDSSAQTITVAIADLASRRVSDYGLLAAAGILAALPASSSAPARNARWSRG
jgi:multiple sugar transport system permease protein